MELVYLWVEKYKNIENEGFNFSPKFTCSYDKDTQVLTIEKKEHIEDFFGKNINVTAIVGENGSGKSSLLSSMIMNEKIFIVVYDKELKVYTNIGNIYTSLTKESLKNSFLKNALYYSMDNLNLAKSRSYLTTIDLEETNRLITKNYLNLQKFDFELFDFKPYFVKYDFVDNWIDSEYESSYRDIENIQSSLNPGNPYSVDSGIIQDTLKALRDIDNPYLIYLFNRFGTIAEIFEHIDLTEKLHPKDFYLMIKYAEVQEVLKKCGLPFLDKDIFDLLEKNKSEFIQIAKLKDIFGKEYLKLFFIDMIDELEFDFMSDNRATYSSLSHGQKTIYSFYVHLVNYTKEEFLFLLDEPDNTLHPNWQKKFINEIIKIIKRLEKKVHFAITSHSPFILSDLPKENVIFLKKDENGNCKNVTKETNIDTFGANIHTLLSHGFFMQDGLMGEFAKEKIQAVIDFLNGAEKSELNQQKTWAIIQLIGEPFLKHKLEEKFYEKFSTDEQKRIIKIKQLEDELQRLKNVKSED